MIPGSKPNADSAQSDVVVVVAAAVGLSDISRMSTGAQIFATCRRGVMESRAAMRGVDLEAAADYNPFSDGRRIRYIDSHLRTGVRWKPRGGTGWGSAITSAECQGSCEEVVAGPDRRDRHGELAVHPGRCSDWNRFFGVLTRSGRGRNVVARVRCASLVVENLQIAVEVAAAVILMRRIRRRRGKCRPTPEVPGEGQGIAIWVA